MFKGSTEYSFYNYLIDQGYFFDKLIIENYLLSLKVKPFTILTGNSGTGKTKLSQLFAKFLSNLNNTSNESDDINLELNGYFSVKVKTNYSSIMSNGPVPIIGFHSPIHFLGFILLFF